MMEKEPTLKVGEKVMVVDLKSLPNITPFGVNIDMFPYSRREATITAVCPNSYVSQSCHSIDGIESDQARYNIDIDNGYFMWSNISLRRVENQLKVVEEEL